MRRSNQKSLVLSESRQYAFLGAMIAGTYISTITLLGSTTSIFKLIAFPYFLFATGMNYFFPIESCISATCNHVWFVLTSLSFIFVVGFFCYLVGREKERRELF